MMKLKKMLAAALSGVMLMSAAAAAVPQGAWAAGDCVVDTGTTYQTIRGFGGINLPEWISEGDMTDAQVQKAFGNGEDELGFTILRIYVSDDSNAWSRAIPTAKRAQALGATVFASPWNPPAAIRNTVNGGLNGGKYQLKKDKWAEYAQHLNSYIKYVEGQGIDLYSVSVQNEPDYAAEWTYWSANDVASFIAQYGKAVKEGTKAKLMSAESFQYQKPIYNAILGNQQAMANCDLFGTHFYGTQRSQMDFPQLENCGKEIWMTEVYVPNSDSNSADRFPEAVQVAENMHNGLVVGNLNAYVWWYIRRQYGPLKENGQISKRGYMMAQYSKWVRPGAVRIGATEQPNNNILCSAYQNEDGSIAVVAINKGSSAVTQNFSLSGVDISDISAYRTSANENIKEISQSASGSSFSSQLPGNSVTTFVIGGTGSGKAPDEPDEDGNLAHYTFEQSSEGFTGRGGASVSQVKSDAYQGSGALSCTDRTATWNGAAHSLNAKMCKPGEEYSFSAAVKYIGGSATEDFHFSLEYKDASGETQYDKIATETVSKGDWVQLANSSYKIPSGATNMQIYIETDSGTVDFLVDEVIIAPKGKEIDGPKAVVVKLGDLDGDGVINSADLSIAKAGASKSFASDKIKQAADINGDGNVDKTDLAWYVEYILGKTDKFLERAAQSEVTPSEPETTEMRTITEYTNAVKNTLAMFETDDSKTKKGGVTYPQIVKEQYFSKKANKNKPYNIMLPANYDSSKKYPVLYLLHGYYENEDRMILEGNSPPIPTPQIITNAIAEGAAKEMIVVVPFVFTSATMNGPSGMDNQSNAAYDAFVDDIVDSLMPHIEGKYSVATGRANTAVTGFSMGGRESLLIGMKHADKFGYIGAICPAPGVGGDWTFGGEDKAPSLILLTAGDNDQTVGSTPSGYHNSMTQKNTPHIWHYVSGGYHGDNCIRAHVYNFVRMIFKA
ncbi:MAG: carbohydrate binding domain-containing protein [Oscillospiraceae bacterium]|nr:carbohydrate binding domain-containing protein [Oscillospiraceae bacterium]